MGHETRAIPDVRTLHEEFEFFVQSVKGYAIFMLSPSGIVQTWNKGAEILKGYTSEEIIGRHFSCFYTPEEVERHYPEENLKLAAERGGLEEEGWRVRKDGTRFWASVVITPIRDRQNQLIGFLKLTRDLTLRKRREVQVEQSLRYSEQLFESLANSISQLTWMGDETGSLFWYNNRWYEYTGTNFEEMKGWGWQSVHQPKELKRILKGWQRALASGEPWEDTFPLRSKTGEWRWFLSRAMPIRDKQGHVWRWFGTNTDVTEQRERVISEQFLSEAAMKLFSSLDVDQNLRDVANLAVPRFGDWCVVDLLEKGTLRRVATSYSDPAKEQLARAFEHLLPDLNAPGGAARAIRTRQPVIYTDGDAIELLMMGTNEPDQIAIIQRLGIQSYISVPILFRGSLLGALTVISSRPERHYTVRDMEVMQEFSSRAAIAIENSILYRSAEAAIRARDEFISVASHELKTPITSMKMQVEILSRKLSNSGIAALDPGKLACVLANYRQQLGRLTRLIEDMLDVSRIRTGKLSMEFAHHSLSELVDEVANRFKQIYKAQGGEIRVLIENRIIGYFDRFRIEQALVNLLSNAMHYGEGRPIEVKLVRKGKHNAEILVRDFGPGISTQDQVRIFNRFERAMPEAKVKGLGLGLYITKNIIDAHGGSIQLESELGRGSCFIMKLPLEKGMVKTEGKVPDAA